MSALGRTILIFSLAFTVFIIGPAFMGSQFGPYPLMKWGDVFDLLTPMALLPLYWLMFVTCCQETPSQREDIVIIALAGLWAMGQGMHLAANSIGHLLEGMEGSGVYRLMHFYDEVLSHYLWHLGIVGLAVLLLVRGWRQPYSAARGLSWPVILAGVIHGLTLFMIFIEAGTVPLGIAFSLVTALVILVWGRDKLEGQPLVTFFLVSCIVALLFIAGWGIYWGQWPIPQFSEVGLL